MISYLIFFTVILQVNFSRVTSPVSGLTIAMPCLWCVLALPLKIKFGLNESVISELAATSIVAVLFVSTLAGLKSSVNYKILIILSTVI